jgi:hypothetical protein
MTKEEISKKIEELETQYAELEAQERIEKEEAKKKADAERDADLLAIMNSVKAFNEKYGENVLLLTQKDTRNLTLNDLFFPWL